ncbi:DUF5317 domain-containing protein [Ectobacillus antri]|uniref:DUF5317 domain-containing protein n=1 Tax=Ectobacillus antri TaxID=2486280 RepID=A0ABT6H9Q8_9BACI|nr:DUF5317 domain-containing protein [Ectobacillus antri]MDG4658354.1 DUF5317 domain-containing protein [Ectobacillus antri]MDG5755420.1 DUF5317 domain-containing protein [Ectobacillus antri]
MVFDGILLSIIIGFLRKGSLKGLADFHVKHGWIFPVLLLIEVFVFIMQDKILFVKTLSNYIYILVYIVGLFFLYINRHHRGFTIILIGVLLNFIVIAANGGRMPVSIEAATVLDPVFVDMLKNGDLYAKHQALTSDTNLGFLGDIIPITDPYPKSQVISIGDVIMNVGIFIFIQWLMVTSRRTPSFKGGETA